MTDEQFMKRALELAERGRGLTSPGAMVGAVVVRDDQVVGEGVYTWDGVRHAEIQALAAAGTRAEAATLYINLEPCSHHGRTPPCVESVIAARVARVVVSIQDPNPDVNGQGLEVLREAKVEVECGVLASEARQLNESFIHRTKSDRPFGILKVAMSLDGKIATASGESRWITCEESRHRVHLMRHAADALVTGSGTVLHDDPLLTDRSGKPRRRPLIRTVIDRRGRLGSHLRIFESPGVLVYTQVPDLELPESHEVVVGVTDLVEVVHNLADRDVQTMLLECGPDLAFDALRRGIIDKIVVFLAPRVLGGREVPAFGSEGVASLSDAVEVQDWTVEPVGKDFMVTGYVHGDC